MTKTVDVSGKKEVMRIAKAEGEILLRPETVKAIVERRVEKGDPLAAAEFAALLAVKKTSELLPHCHPLPLTHIEARVVPFEKGVKASVEVRAVARTGVEMEALVGVTAALLTVWDMVKGLEKDEKGQYPTSRITEIRVTEKVKDS
ncbi:MAG: cyclic pyranopterin monophosphate synthase MoaC [Hadesarchaea archaeon]|nr:MAG: cyclic pyranopterin monophosphate synthase MoaC [Hadesarchaea archaeon]